MLDVMVTGLFLEIMPSHLMKNTLKSILLDMECSLILKP